MLANRLGCQREPKVRARLTRLYDCLRDKRGRVDWRQLVCALYALGNTRHVHKNPIKLLTIFFRLYSVPNVPHGDVVFRRDVLNILSFAAVTHSDASAMARIGHHLPKIVNLPAFNSSLENHPEIAQAFRRQLWKQLPDLPKLPTVVILRGAK